MVVQIQTCSFYSNWRWNNEVKTVLKNNEPNKPFYIECDGCVLDYDTVEQLPEDILNAELLKSIKDKVTGEMIFVIKIY